MNKLSPTKTLKTVMGFFEKDDPSDALVKFLHEGFRTIFKDLTVEKEIQLMELAVVALCYGCIDAMDDVSKIITTEKDKK